MNNKVEISIDRQEGLDAVLSVTILPEDYQAEIDNNLGQYSKKLNIKGFRPGKVPRQIVKKMFYEDIKKEQVQKLVESGIKNYLSKKELKLLMEPLLVDGNEINWKIESPIEFRYDIGLRPEIDFKPGQLGDVPKIMLDIQQEDIEQEIDLLRKDKGSVNKLHEISEVENLNMLLKLQEQDAEGKIQEGGVSKTKVVGLKELNDKFKEVLLGKKAKESITLDLKNMLSSEEISKLLEVDDLTVQDLNPGFQVEILDVFALEPAALDEAFFQTVFGGKEISDKEQLEEEIRKILEWHYERESNNMLFKEIKERVFSNVNIELPEKYLQRWLKLVSEKKEDKAANFEHRYNDLLKELKWEVFTSHVSDEQKIEISETEIIDFTKALFNERFQRAGLSGQIDDGMLIQYVFEYLRDQNNLSMVKVNIRDQKVFDYLAGQVNLVEKPVIKSEFDKLRQEK